MTDSTNGPDDGAAVRTGEHPVVGGDGATASGRARPSPAPRPSATPADDELVDGNGTTAPSGGAPAAGGDAAALDDGVGALDHGQAARGGGAVAAGVAPVARGGGPATFDDGPALGDGPVASYHGRVSATGSGFAQLGVAPAASATDEPSASAPASTDPTPPAAAPLPAAGSAPPPAAAVPTPPAGTLREPGEVPGPGQAVATPEDGVERVEPAPTPSPGPVPSPGPGAAAPPPWRRMPPLDAPVEPPTPPRSAEPDLLDDVPTAFVEPAGPSGPTVDDPTRPTAHERAGWTTMRTRARPPRRAALQLKRLDPWSVLKLALVLSGVLFLIFLVAVGVLYGVLDGIGVWDRLNGTYSDLVSGEGSSGEPLISAWRVLGWTAFIGAVNSVLFAVALTLGAFVYNVSADLVGGIEVTLSERD